MVICSRSRWQLLIINSFLVFAFDVLHLYKKPIQWFLSSHSIRLFDFWYHLVLDDKIQFFAYVLCILPTLNALFAFHLDLPACLLTLGSHLNHNGNHIPPSPNYGFLKNIWPWFLCQMKCLLIAFVSFPCVLVFHL